MIPLAFTALGRPQPQGSTRAFAIKSGGAYTGRVVVTSDNPTLAEWKGRIASAALTARVEAGLDLALGPVRLDLLYVLARPKGHYGSGRNAARVRGAAPAEPITKPDIDKLERAVLDACTGVIWRDDAQVVSVFHAKQYGEPQRVEVIVR